MKRLNLLSLYLFFSFISLAACSSVEEPYTKQTFPVKGKITVDGQDPGSPIQIKCISKGAVDEEHPTISGGLTQNDGSFELSTYTSGDGLPVGDYALTFEWKKLDLMTRSYGGPDKLKKRYNDPKKPKIEFSVKEEGDAIDLGVIELTTK